MIPILEPVQYPAIFFNGILITVMTGIPAVLFALIIFFILERVPFRRARLLLPVAGAVLMVVITILSSHPGPPSPDEYERNWVLMRLTGFLMDALVILAPFPFVRKYTEEYSPYLVIPCTLVITFFILVAFGFMGGDAQIAPDTWIALTLHTVYFAIAEFVIAALVYCGIGWVGKLQSRKI
jgi:peptidoglycan/LPS O-acetylase OafA/YrhL